MFVGDINGNTVRYDSSNAINTTEHHSEIGQDTCTHIYGSGLVNFTATQTYIIVNLGTLVLDISTTGCYPDAQTFLNLFQTGNSYPFTAEGDNGVEFIYWDNNNKYWSTSLAPATQTNSSFILNEIKEEYVGLTQLVKFKATINCTLYDSSGNSLSLTNGVMVGNFENMH